MTQRLSEVYRQADSNLLAGELDRALAGFTAIIKTDGQQIWPRLKIGMVLEQQKDVNRACEVYKAVAWHCIKSGFPLMGLLCTKRASRLQGGSEETLGILAELYGLESDRVVQDLPIPELPLPNPDLPVDVGSLTGEKISALATQVARDFPDPRYPRELPAIPLFSLLTAEAFYPILEILDLKTFLPGEFIVKQGEPCDAIYMLAHGEVEVVEGLGGQDGRTLARLTSGAVFGEMALITDAPRLASARAVRESEVLILRREDLDAAAEDLDDLTWAMAKFTRQRFLQHVLLTTPVFAPFGAAERKEILERFTSVGVPTDEVVIQEGTPGPGLYIILGGEVEVSKFEGGTRVHLTRLAEGAVFGEISLIHDAPTTATVQAVRGGEFLFLSREDFQTLVASRPAIRDSLRSLGEARLAEQSKAMQDAGLVSKDGSVIF
ncbi:MAG TPA: cyclic nucleotide-binding domain-containing protein [Myxococcota bacterium]|nr:cyclic nucleotide-binding domain-containing protein [Myxococcota bacterium]HRY96492.1 cyclic nucleotide-binding domain-containing protein [Myxococcota bacterium]HSA21827.1 cyclic nucleotide-binding domain-containing protein [Myxococcota bacterium]